MSPSFMQQFVEDNKELAAGVVSACDHLRGYFIHCKGASKASNGICNDKDVKALQSSLKRYYDAMLVVTSKYNFKTLQH